MVRTKKDISSVPKVSQMEEFCRSSVEEQITFTVGISQVQACFTECLPDRVRT